jgi:hypothetical protein
VIEGDTGFARLADREEIRDLVHRYSYLFDTSNFAAAAALFTPDCRFAIGAHAEWIEGRAALLRWWESLVPADAEPTAHEPADGSIVASMHHNANVVIRFGGPDSASGRASLYGVNRLAGGGEFESFGYYHDRYIQTGSGWLFCERRLVSTHRRTGGRLVAP